tara:strand:- start:3145 stop:3363 length:219 start_codon:yes stop_codon:yes gene_type:complete
MIVERISETMFTIDGKLVELHQGDVEFANGDDMTYYQFRAICEFMDEEEQNVRILARKSVKELLNELNIKSE